MRDEPRHSSTNESGPDCMEWRSLEAFLVDSTLNSPIMTWKLFSVKTFNHLDASSLARTLVGSENREMLTILLVFNNNNIISDHYLET